MAKTAHSQGRVWELKLMMECGWVYRDAGRLAEARDIYQGVRALLPTYEGAHLALSMVCMDEGKLDESEEHCKRILQLNPSSSAAYTQMAEVQIRKGRLEEAERGLQRALKISPNGASAALAKALQGIISAQRPKVAVVPNRKRF
jgi:Tfp pilus assembly protein PilF